MIYYHEVELEEVQQGADSCHEEKMEESSRTWTIAIVPIDDAHKPDLAFAVLCGVMIFTAFLLLAWIWIIRNRHHSKQEVNKIVHKAAAESAIVSSLHPAAIRELLIDGATKTKDVELKMPTKQGAIKNDGNEAKKLHDLNLDQDTSSECICGSMPTAELCPRTTTM